MIINAGNKWMSYIDVYLDLTMLGPSVLEKYSQKGTILFH